MFKEELFPATPDTEISEEEQQTYQKIVGSILFTTISSRPDIAFAASQLSKFNQRPIPQYMETARRVVRYLYKTRFLYLQYRNQRRNSAKSFICTNNISFADNTLDRKSF